MDAAASSPFEHRERLLKTLVFTLILSVMSATMFNIVLTEISMEFQLSLAQVSWVTSAYMLVYAMGAVIYGKLADRFPLRNLITFGILIFVGGSLLGLTSQAYSMVLVGRVLQAMGASVIPATGMLIPLRYFPEGERGRALGTAAAGLALGGALGPMLSAFIVSVLDWRWLFCLPLLTLFTLPFYRKYLTDTTVKQVSMDWLGGGLLAGAVASLLLAVTNESWLPGGTGAILFVLFLWRIHAVKAPFVQPKLFRNKQYTWGLFIAFGINIIGFSLPFLSPLLLAQVNQLPPGWVGLVLVPAAVFSALLGRKAGKLADTKGSAFLFFVASGLMFIGLMLLSVLSGAHALWIAVFLIFGQLGQISMMVALSNTVSRTLPKDQTGVGMGLLSMLNFIAAAIAAGVYSKIVDQGAEVPWNVLNPYGNAAVFSNIYLILAGGLMCLAMIYRWTYGKKAGSKIPSKTETAPSR
ncbi:antiporter [Paenibacillus swuensis]|uniref:Antiporter n=1 Tax=Paenibacillus swuensis TaxID=1178515 RepID=A0A172TP73_9BACL|nr:antiporter [Paenibacillus swuensis]